MIREGYVERLIAQFSQALAHILGFTKKKHYKAAVAAIAQAFQQLGISLESVDELSESWLVTTLMLGETAAAGREKCAYAVALLKEAGVVHAAQGRVDESCEYYLKALHLLLELLRRDGGVRLASYVITVEELVAELRACDFILPVETNQALMDYYEQIGAYGKAEDVLFEMIEASPGNMEVVGMGIAFYEHLKHQSDEVLESGNLPRDEVEAGLAELQLYQSS